MRNWQALKVNNRREALIKQKEVELSAGGWKPPPPEANQVNEQNYPAST